MKKLALSLCILALASCGSDYDAGPAPAGGALLPTGPATPPPPGPPGTPPAPGTPGDATATQQAPTAPTLPEYREEAFVEATTNRDPFRRYARLVRPPPRVERTVVMGNVGVDQMRLVAVVTGVASPRAMLTDAAGIGFVVEHGDYVGRADVVQIGDDEQTPVTLNWRVDRIRAQEVVLTREDPTAPDRPPLTRIIALRQDEARAQSGG